MSVTISGSDLVRDQSGKEYRVYTIVYEAADGTATESNHRYNDFLELHERLPSLAGTRFPAPKSMFGLNNESAIKERIGTLQDYLRFLLSKLEADERPPLEEFLNLSAATVAPITPTQPQPPRAPPGALASASVLGAALVARVSETKVATPAKTAAALEADAPVTSPVVGMCYTSSVNLNIDQNSADGRAAVKIDSINATPKGTKRKMTQLPALFVLLGVVPAALIGSLVGLGIVSNHSSGGSVGTALGMPRDAALPPCEPSGGMLALSSYPSGLVFAYTGGEWQSLCAGSVLKGKPADLICKELGYEKASNVFAANSSKAPLLKVDNFQCTGKEATLLGCRQHTLQLNHPLCDVKQAQAIMCEGGEVLEAPSNCAASVAPLLLRSQHAAAMLPGESGSWN